MSLEDFDEVRFEDGIITRGTSGGPSFNTTVVTTQSGKEYRVQNWRFSRGSWQVGNRTLTPVELKITQAFFQARAGKARGFRFKDWGDYKDELNGVCGRVISDGSANIIIDGSGYYSFYKKYNSGGTLYYRRVSKPVPSTVKVFKNGTEVSQGTGPGDCQIDYIRGMVHFTPLSTKTIISITRDSNGLVRVDNHGFNTNDRIAIVCSGMTEVSNRAFTITVQNNNHFFINENTSDYEAFTSGVVEVHAKTGEILSWTGEFDVPVRFDSDKLDVYFEERIKYTNKDNEEVYYQLNSLPVVEIKID
jgi:uncharacterized protein (TIGR02217 family)